MFKNKGLYEWKLIENDKVVSEGSQWNTSTDQMPLVFGCWEGTGLFSGFSREITLSGSTVPAEDFRQRYSPWQRITTLSSGRSTSLSLITDPILNSAYVQYLFAPPGAPRTIRVIGSNFYAGSDYPYDYASFIELSVPITQQINQYLFVKYTIFYSFTAGGYNSPNNHYIQRKITQNLMYYAHQVFGLNSNVQGISPFNPPTTLNNVMRHIWELDIAASIQWSGPCYGHKWVRDYATTELVGPMGVFVFGFPMRGSNPQDIAVTIGYSTPSDFGPAISRVFAHPSGYMDQIFSDPGHTPSSQGTIALSGTPTNKHPIIGRVRITKTGDASDIIDDTFTVSGPPTDTIVTDSSQGHLVDELVRFTSTITLPDPLLPDTSYHIVYKSGTSMKVSSVQGGTPITLNDVGTGIHTVIRWNTGRFSLELEPWSYIYSAGSWRGYPVWQLSMGVDVDGKMQAHDNQESIAEDQATARTDNMIEDQVQVGDFIYSIQKSRSTELQNVCRWRFWTIETSEALCKFGTTGTKAYRMVKVGTNVYIATSDGLYLYNTLTPTVAPSLLTITNILSNPIYDLAYDPISGYLWSGHTTGLSKIDLGASTATQYITGVGEKLEGMSAGRAHIATGQLEAYNGRVIRGGCQLRAGDQYFTDGEKAWVLQDEVHDGNSIGWCSFGGAYDGSARGTCLRKGTNEIVDVSAHNLNRYTVVVTGVGTGNITTEDAWYLEGVTAYYEGYVVQLSDKIFKFLVRHSGGGGTFYGQTYVIGGSHRSLIIDASFSSWSQAYQYMGWPYGGTTNWWAHAFRNTVDLGNGVIVPIAHFNSMHYNAELGYPTPFGWSGSAWIKDNTGDRPIPKTGTTALLQGVSVAFNNATGKPWDQQFVLGDRFTWVHGPNKIKDNLQTMSVAAKNYHVPVDVANAIAFQIPAATPYVKHVTETTDPDFRATDPDPMVVKVMEGVTAYTSYTPTITSTWSVSDLPNDTIACGLNIADGTPVKLYHSETNRPYFMFPTPLVDGGIYYAINVDTTHIKLAATYADAMAHTPIDFKNGGYAFGPVWRIAVITPGTGEYSFGSNGVFIFAAADANKNLTLTYTYSLFA